MTRFDLRDLIGGLALTLVGVFFAYNSAHYSLGQLQSMGAGMFPLILSVCLSVLGLAIMIPALFRSAEPIAWKLKDPAIVTVSIVAFALILDVAGVLVSVVVSILIASFAVKLTWLWRVVLGMAVAGFTYVLFVRVLGMNIPVWPRLG